MALGLGFARPELRKAQMMAKLNGSTALPQDPGADFQPPQQGMGPPQAPPAAASQPPPASSVQPLPMPDMQVQPRSAPQQQAPQEAPPEADDGTPQWAKIAGALGHIILSADAGYHGRPMPEPPGGDPRQQQDQEMRKTEFLFNSVARAWEISRNAEPGKREAMLQQFDEAIRRVEPNFDLMEMMDSLETDADRVDEMAPDLAAMSPEAKDMFMSGLRARGGDAAAAADLLKDKTFMQTLQDFEDRRNATALKFKSAQFRQAMKKLGMPDDSFKDTSPDDFAAFNEQMPKGAQLTPSEMQSIKRRPELAALFGLRSPQTQDPQTLDSRAGVSRPTSDGPAAGAPSRPAASPPPPAASPTAPPSSPRTRPRAPVTSKAPPPAPPAKAAKAPPPKAAPQGVQHFKIPEGGKNIPGVGPMKEGETVIYDPATRKYRRG